MFTKTFVCDEIRAEGSYKVYEADIFDNKVEMIIRDSDNKAFFSTADILRMCQLANRGSYSTNLTNNSSEVIRSAKKVYVDGMAMMSYIFKGRNEGIVQIKEKFLNFFLENIDQV